MKRGKVVFVLGVLSLLVFQACGFNLHQHFSGAQVKNDTYTYVTNDSAKVNLRAPGDIEFITDAKAAKTFLKKEWDLQVPENVLFVGKSTVAPFYKLIILMDNEENLHHPEFSGIKILSFKRQIGGRQFNLIARSEEPNLRPDDFESILDNLTVRQ